MADQTPSTPDILAFADEAGRRGLLRDLTPRDDAEIGVLCTLPIPARYVDAVRSEIQPLFDRFVAAAPQGAKLHITDAFAPGNESWGKIADAVRTELFDLMHKRRIISIYVARRARVARQSFENAQAAVATAKEGRTSNIKITGENRPSDERIEDNMMVSLGLMLDAFAEQEKGSRIDVMFDQIDKPIADRFERALELTRNVSTSQTTVHGWDPDKGEKVSGEIVMKAGAPFRLDSQYLGRISVVGKIDPLVFAADVVANSLWRHLRTLPAEADLNGPDSVAGWPLGPLVWGKDAEKGFDRF